MGWKSTLRSLQAAARRAEREAERRQRELERERRRLEKAQAHARAAHEVEVFENYIDLLVTVHKECGAEWDWNAIHSMPPPAEPERLHAHEQSAQRALAAYEPGFLDKLLKREETKRGALQAAVRAAQLKDEAESANALQAWQTEYAGWEEARALAERILDGRVDACLEAIEETDPFSDISHLGSSVSFSVPSAHLVEARLHVNSEQVVPSETKSLLKSGKVSLRKMTKTKYYELYQDYVCGCVLRVGRELLALLPVQMVIATAWSRLLNTQTGHQEEQPILSVAMARQTMKMLNFDFLDPSDSLANFVHRMNFRKTKGFASIDPLRPADFAQDAAE